MLRRLRNTLKPALVNACGGSVKHLNSHVWLSFWALKCFYIFLCRKI
ncbi:Hypothetical protein FNO222_0372 [Francisella orientalis]|uniref:Uncharacterized protein n=1 Tax=Francisella orientalis TaxID=299583 RepID=A0ABM5U5Q9_9GAMM|nr:hypothetical protein FNO12_0370 [Francisella orientalis FNO12]AKN86673.1 Hypothetical protein FNO24_0370 [Francisella orientalis FNO24]AKN88212.1 Hypothetical protein FNO190_0370 [Francisella orientalis]AKU04966.1 Hypothetical protein FNO01_0370 [Francisella orientalis]QEN19875.1 Hypothetical protein FNO39_0372 [Francisella orientalis]